MCAAYRCPEKVGLFCKLALQNWDADRTFRVVGAVPAPYPIPNDGPVGQMLDARGRQEAPFAHRRLRLKDLGHRVAWPAATWQLGVFVTEAPSSVARQTAALTSAGNAGCGVDGAGSAGGARTGGAGPEGQGVYDVALYMHSMTEAGEQF